MDNTTLTDDLIAEIEPQGKGKTIHHEGRMYYPAEMVNSLIAKNRALLADAERYRWLRSNWFNVYGESSKSCPLKITTGGSWNGHGTPGHVDAAIDAARQASKKEGGE